VVFSDPPVSSTNKTDRHDIAEILLKVALSTNNHHQPPPTLRLIGTLLIDCFFYMSSKQYFSRVRNENNKEVALKWAYLHVEA
jgi:hypothetical protein